MICMDALCVRLPIDTFWLTRGTRRIQHGRAEKLILNWRFRQLRQFLVQSLEACNVAANGQAAPQPASGRSGLRRHLGEACGSDEQLGFAIGDDVRRLILLQVRADRREDNAGAKRTLSHLQKLGAVLHHDGDVIAAIHAGGTQQMRNLVRSTVQLRVGHNLTGVGHNVCRPIGGFSGEGRKMRHGVTLFWAYDS